MKALKMIHRKILSLALVLGVLLLQASCAGGRMYSTANNQYIDPVCGTQVSADTHWQSTYEGRTYYFSSEECLAVFEKNPARFTQNQARHGGHMGMDGLGWWGPVLGVIMVGGMIAAMVIGVNH